MRMIDDMLNRLDRVKETGKGQFIARCPAHDDRSPSLAIKDHDDGRVLIHCFAGCETEDVLTAIGMTFSNIMPERIGTEHRYKPIRFNARQVLECVSHEVTVVCLLAEKIECDKSLTDSDNERLTLAARRINTALDSAPPLRTPEINRIRSAAR